MIDVVCYVRRASEVSYENPVIVITSVCVDIVLVHQPFSVLTVRDADVEWQYKIACLLIFSFHRENTDNEQMIFTFSGICT